jgi:hypothetical protein
MPKTSSTFRVEVEYKDDKKEIHGISLNHEASAEYAAKYLADIAHFPGAVHLHVVHSDEPMPPELQAKLKDAMPELVKRATFSTTNAPRESKVAMELNAVAAELAKAKQEDPKHKVAVPQDARIGVEPEKTST